MRSTFSFDPIISSEFLHCKRGFLTADETYLHSSFSYQSLCAFFLSYDWLRLLDFGVWRGKRFHSFSCYEVYVSSAVAPTPPPDTHTSVSVSLAKPFSTVSVAIYRGEERETDSQHISPRQDQELLKQTTWDGKYFLLKCIERFPVKCPLLWKRNQAQHCLLVCQGVCICFRVSLCFSVV